MIPGLNGSDQNHWQTIWERKYGFSRVEQKDWSKPVYAEWEHNLIKFIHYDEDEKSHIIVAHSLGTILIVKALHKIREYVKGIILVATPDTYGSEFREYIQWRGIEVNENYSSAKKAEIINAYNYYAANSSLPELLLEKDVSLHYPILHEYINMIVYKDLIERHGLTQHTLIKHFIKFLAVNISNFISINKLFNDFKSRGLHLSKNSLYDFLTYLEDSYVFYTTSIYSLSVREQQRNPKKVYAIDIGLKKLMDFEEDKGRILENIIFLELRRNYKEIYYLKGEKEVDFYVNSARRVQLFNVAIDIEDKKTYNREVNGLLEAMAYLNIPNSTLIVGEGKENTIINNNYRIDIIPAWKWLMTF
jgi:predicted AAA+ superfamily ATPase